MSLGLLGLLQLWLLFFSGEIGVDMISVLLQQ